MRRIMRTRIALLSLLSLPVALLSIPAGSDGSHRKSHHGPAQRRDHIQPRDIQANLRRPGRHRLRGSTAIC